MRKHGFAPFSDESLRIRANLEQSYDSWLDAKRGLAAVPVSMNCLSKQGCDYLYMKQNSQSEGTSLGRRCVDLEFRYQDYLEQKSRSKERSNS